MPRLCCLLLGLLLAGSARAQCNSSSTPATNLQVSAITATGATVTFNGGISICGAARVSYAYAGGSPVSVPYAMPLLLTGLPPATAIIVTVARRAPNVLGAGPSCCDLPTATLTFTTAAPLAATAAVGGGSPVALAPNPAWGRATLTLPAPLPASTLVRVLDARGREVRRLALPARATTALLDVAGLPAGLYLVRVGEATARLMVE